MQLEWRTQSEGRPVTVTLAIQEATYRSERRAHVHLTVTGCRLTSRPQARPSLVHATTERFNA